MSNLDSGKSELNLIDRLNFHIVESVCNNIKSKKKNCFLKSGQAMVTD